MARIQNVLTQLETFKAYQLIDSWRDMIERDGWTLPQIAQEVQNRTGFTFNTNNAETAVNQLGIKLKLSKKAELSESVDSIKAECVELRAKCDSLANDAVIRDSLLTEQSDRISSLSATVATQERELAEEVQRNAELVERFRALAEQFTRLSEKTNEIREIAEAANRQAGMLMSEIGRARLNNAIRRPV